MVEQAQLHLSVDALPPPIQNRLRRMRAIFGRSPIFARKCSSLFGMRWMIANLWWCGKLPQLGFQFADAVAAADELVEQVFAFEFELLDEVIFAAVQNPQIGEFFFHGAELGGIGFGV